MSTDLITTLEQAARLPNSIPIEIAWAIEQHGECSTDKLHHPAVDEAMHYVVRQR